MTVLITNNATAALSAGITNVQTTFSVAANGSLFPSPTGADIAYVTFADAAGNVEIVSYTTRSGNSFSGVTRGRDNTTALAFSSGDKVELRPVAAHFTPAAIGAAKVPTKVAMGALDIDLSAGNYFTKTLSTGSNTITVSNANTGGTLVNEFLLRATSTGASSITFGTGFTSVKYVNGSALSLTSGGIDWVSGVSLDGANWDIFVQKAMA